MAELVKLFIAGHWSFDAPLKLNVMDKLLIVILNISMPLLMF